MKKASIAVVHRLLVVAYHIIRDGTQYREVGGDYFDRLHPERTFSRVDQAVGTNWLPGAGHPGGCAFSFPQHLLPRLRPVNPARLVIVRRAAFRVTISYPPLRLSTTSPALLQMRRLEYFPAFTPETLNGTLRSTIILPEKLLLSSERFRSNGFLGAFVPEGLVRADHRFWGQPLNSN